MRGIRLRRLTALLAILSGVGLSPAAGDEKPAKKKPAQSATRSAVLVIVNGQRITENDLDRSLQMRQVPQESRAELRRQFLDELIDSRLIQQFLKERKITAPKREVDEQVSRIKELARQRGSDPDKVLTSLGYNEEMLREEFAVPLAWKRHIDQAISAKHLQTYFDEHRNWFDGTQVRARQILIKVNQEAGADAWRAAEEQLDALRKKIVRREMSFADAAAAHSQAPSRESGGDVGFFPHSGKMPEQFSVVAFQLKVGEISQPFRSKFGVHLCQVTDRQEGDLSLEDVRPEVLAHVSQEEWKQTVARERKRAKIEWKAEQP